MHYSWNKRVCIRRSLPYVDQERQLPEVHRSVSANPPVIAIIKLWSSEVVRNRYYEFGVISHVSV